MPELVTKLQYARDNFNWASALAVDEGIDPGDYAGPTWQVVERLMRCTAHILEGAAALADVLVLTHSQVEVAP